MTTKKSPRKKIFLKEDALGDRILLIIFFRKCIKKITGLTNKLQLFGMRKKNSSRNKIPFISSKNSFNQNATAAFLHSTYNHFFFLFACFGCCFVLLRENSAVERTVVIVGVFFCFVWENSPNTFFFFLLCCL